MMIMIIIIITIIILIGLPHKMVCRFTRAPAQLPPDSMVQIGHTQV